MTNAGHPDRNSRRTPCSVTWTGILLSGAMVMASCTGEPAVGDRPPNLIFIMADDLGYGDLGCYGQERIQTPRLDQMAAEGRRFTSFYSGSTVCAPSRCALMTGMHMGRAWIRGNGRRALRPEDVTVAEVLQDAGYVTGLMGKWGLGEEGSTGIPTRQGFDEFYGYLNQRHAHNYYPEFLWHNETKVPLRNVVEDKGGLGGVAIEPHEYSHDLITDRALDFVRRNQARPFFLYVAYTIPHANNEAGPKGMEVPELGDYADEDWPDPQKGHAAMITRMDRDVGRLLDELGTLGLDGRTIVFFTSDNGPHAEGGAKPKFFGSAGGLRGIKRDLTEGGIRVPMIVRGPGVPAGTVDDVAWAHWDVFPTLAILGCANVPAGLDGMPFDAALRGQPQMEHEALYWAFYERGGSQAARMGSWKAVAKPADSPLKLYNLATDWGETTDVAADHPEVVAQMQEVFTREYQPSEHWKFPHERE